MRRLTNLLTISLVIVTLASAGPLLLAQKSDLETTLTDTERQLWNAWKAKDGATFDKTLDPNAVTMGDKGLMDRAASIKEITTQNCQVQNFTLSDTKVTQIDKDTALLTYKAHQDATCDGKKIPPTVNVSTVYEKHGDKWQPVFHQETPTPESSTPSSTQ
ncbi:MAG: hypothetical protein JWO20_1022 [Candidatus Angelobacter sp.]|jgi:hypothetical protein|nr:hypothetical protein [Candidatus Angelobacter sp.]